MGNSMETTASVLTFHRLKLYCYCVLLLVTYCIITLLLLITQQFEADVTMSREKGFAQKELINIK